MLIIAPSSINIDESIKKKKWPSLEQYEYIKNRTKIILFNILYFFYQKIKDYKNQEKEYTNKIEKEKEDEAKNVESLKKNLESLDSLKKVYIENLGFIINNIYFLILF